MHALVGLLVGWAVDGLEHAVDVSENAGPREGLDAPRPQEGDVELPEGLLSCRQTPRYASARALAPLRA